MGWAKAEVTLVAIGKAQQFRTVVVPAAGFTPQLGGLHGGAACMLLEQAAAASYRANPNPNSEL